MSVDLDVAIDGATTFIEIEEALEGAEAKLVFKNGEYQGRHVISSKHTGFISLDALARRVGEQFITRGCLPQEDEALKSLCNRITLWGGLLGVQAFKMAFKIPMEEVKKTIQPFASELRNKSPQEGFQFMAEKGWIHSNCVPLLVDMIENEVDCDFLDEDEEPSKWYTEASWAHRYPGVEMPNYWSRHTVTEINGEDVSLYYFRESAIEAALNFNSQENAS